jgi:hypothetical protein
MTEFDIPGTEFTGRLRGFIYQRGVSLVRMRKNAAIIETRYRDQKVPKKPTALVHERQYSNCLLFIIPSYKVVTVITIYTFEMPLPGKEVINLCIL